MSQINEPNNKLEVVEKTIGFLSRIKKYIIIGVPVLIIAITAVVVIYAIKDSTANKAMARIIQIEELLMDNSISTDETVQSPSADIIQELDSLVQQDSKWISAKAAVLLAGIYTIEKDWSKAVDILDAVNIEKASYLAPVVLFNAGSISEEMGDADKALQFYERCDTLYRNSFPEAPRVIFAIARIQEIKKSTDKAIEQYNLLIDTWPEDDFSSMARTRLIALDATKGE